jgi:biotin carboxyl carrier protein
MTGRSAPEVNQVPGEHPSLSEILIVSPGHGRFERGSIESGHPVEPGTLLGVVLDGGPEILVRSPIPGVFLSWMSWGGERVTPGVPLARIGRLAS